MASQHRVSVIRLRKVSSTNYAALLSHLSTYSSLSQVRKQAAEQLYVQLMTIEDMGLYDEDCLEAAYDVLTEVAWDGPVEQVKAARAQLLQIFQLDAPDCCSSTAAAELQQMRQVGSRRADENASYQALINDGSRL